jgi:hypothetical protein
MTDDSTQTNENDRPRQGMPAPEKAEQASRPAQQTQTAAAGEPGQRDQRGAPGRRPLFRR